MGEHETRLTLLLLHLRPFGQKEERERNKERVSGRRYKKKKS